MHQKGPLCRRLQLLVLVAFIGAPPLQGVGKAEIDQAIGLAVSARYEEALQIFRIEQMRHPDDPLIGYFVGMTEFKLERFSRAIANFEESIKNGAEFPQVFHWLAEAYRRKALPERAAAVLRRGLQRFPFNEDLRTLGRELGVESPR